MTPRRATALSAATVGTLALTTGLAAAAALEQTVPATIRLLYQEGRYVEFGFTYSDPDQSGDGVNVPPSPTGIPPAGFYPGNTGDVFEDRWSLSGAFRDDITDTLSYALIFDEPYIAKTRYGPGSFALPLYDGSMADLRTYQVSAVLAYDATPNIKVFGGLRAQRLDARAAIPFVDGYSVDAGHDWGFGYLVGAAFEKPEIALRVALTYNSKIGHSLDTDEFTNTTGDVGTHTDVDTPQSASLEAQTGINPRTLIFGSIRWVDWSEFAIDPPLYNAAITGLLGEARPLVDYSDDWWTYTLGIGRQITDDLAGAFQVAYEPDVGGVMTTLGPYDGRTTATASLTYEVGQFDITGGLSYGVLGDTKNVLGTDFNDGSVWGAGLRIGYTF